MGFFGRNKYKTEDTNTSSVSTSNTSTVAKESNVSSGNKEIVILAAGKEPKTVTYEDGATIEDVLIDADIDATKVTVDGNEYDLSDEIPNGAKKIVAIPNVKGG